MRNAEGRTGVDAGHTRLLSALMKLGGQLLLWVGLLGYLVFQFMALLGGPFRTQFLAVMTPLVLTLVSGVVLVGVRYRPAFLQNSSYVEPTLFVLNGVLFCGVVGVARSAPYTVGTMYLSLYHSTGVFEVNPLLSTLLSPMLFLAALGHAARLGSLPGRLLGLDVPVLVTLALDVWLSQHVPPYTG